VPINAESVDRGIDNSRNTLCFVFQSKSYENSEALVVQQGPSVKLDFTPEEWWIRLVYRHLDPSKELSNRLSSFLRFFELMNDSVLARNPHLMSFLSQDLDLSRTEGKCCGIRPKTALVTLYRALNLSGFLDGNEFKINCFVKKTSAEESTALCNAIRCNFFLLQYLIRRDNLSSDQLRVMEYYTDRCPKLIIQSLYHLHTHRYLELLEKQTISVKDLAASSEIYHSSFGATECEKNGLTQQSTSDETRNKSFRSIDAFYPSNIKLQESSECVWNLFDGSILYPAQQEKEIDAITSCEAQHQNLSLRRRKTDNDINSESAKKQCAFQDNVLDSQNFSLDGNDISLSADIFL
jgi:hypothetical protein